MAWILVLCIAAGGRFCGEKVEIDMPSATACRHMLAAYAQDKRVVAYCRPKTGRL